VSLKIYFDDKSTFQISSPQIGEILNALGVAFAFDVIALLRKDNLHIDDADRDLI
jgi:L-asparaginase